MARMLGDPKPAYTPEDLLRQIETTRYRGGECHGNYLDRLHDLADWFVDNGRRGTIDDTPSAYLHPFEKHAGILVARARE